MVPDRQPATLRRQDRRRDPLPRLARQKQQPRRHEHQRLDHRRAEHPEQHVRRHHRRHRRRPRRRPDRRRAHRPERQHRPDDQHPINQPGHPRPDRGNPRHRVPQRRLPLDRAPRPAARSQTATPHRLMDRGKPVHAGHLHQQRRAGNRPNARRRRAVLVPRVQTETPPRRQEHRPQQQHPQQRVALARPGPRDMGQPHQHHPAAQRGQPASPPHQPQQRQHQQRRAQTAARPRQTRGGCGRTDTNRSAAGRERFPQAVAGPDHQQHTRHHTEQRQAPRVDRHQLEHPPERSIASRRRRPRGPAVSPRRRVHPLAQHFTPPTDPLPSASAGRPHLNRPHPRPIILPGALRYFHRPNATTSSPPSP